MKFCLDEDLSPTIAALSRSRGLDIVSVHERGERGLPDIEVLRRAASEGRCVVSRNYADFSNLTRQAQAHAAPHAGVLLVPGPARADRYARIVAALVRVDALYPDGLAPYSLLWLPVE
jgi:predicted nuclease of predicted toxin-antitoxin system